MRYFTKEYYNLLMSLGNADVYEPVPDKECTEEEIENLYHKMMEKYVEEEREAVFDDEDDDLKVVVNDLDDHEELSQLLANALETIQAREEFDEEEIREEFEEMYRDNLGEPDEDLPDWVRNRVDPRVLAMYAMPESIHQQLKTEEDAMEEKFEQLDESAEEAREELKAVLPEEYKNVIEAFEELEDAYVTAMMIEDDIFELCMEDFDDDGDEVLWTLQCQNCEWIEKEDLNVSAWKDEDGDTESDCDFLYGEIYRENGKPEIHMLFDNKGLKQIAFRCANLVLLREEELQVSI